MHQYWLIHCNRRATLVQGATNQGNCVQGAGVHGNSSNFLLNFYRSSSHTSPCILLNWDHGITDSGSTNVRPSSLISSLNLVCLEVSGWKSSHCLCTRSEASGKRRTRLRPGSGGTLTARVMFITVNPGPFILRSTPLAGGMGTPASASPLALLGHMQVPWRHVHGLSRAQPCPRKVPPESLTCRGREGGCSCK